MTFVKDSNGNIVGKFNRSKVSVIASTKRQNDTRWERLLKTLLGNYVLEYVTLWQGEENRYKAVTPEEAVIFMEKSGCDAKDICREFADYIEQETI